MPDGGSWQDAVLGEFTPGLSPVIVVADPDGVLRNEGVLATLYGRGFVLLQFDDPIAFRYAYESHYRRLRRSAEGACLVVCVSGHSTALDDLPYDILAGARRVSLSLSALFPRLDQAVLRTLAPDDWDALHLAEVRSGATAVLGESATKDYVLRHVFGIQPELLSSSAALLAALLRRHYPARRMPTILNERVVQALRPRFQDWPLEHIVPDRAAFLDFLQERWPVFLNAQVESTGSVREGATFALRGPGLLPFGNPDVRVYMDNLFAEGLLRPIAHWHANSLRKTWLGVGIRSQQQADGTARLDRLLAIASKALPGQKARHERWFHFASVWANVLTLAHDPNRQPSANQQREIDTLRTRMDAAFADWLRNSYAGLANLPPVPPVMLHHIPRSLAREVGRAAKHAPGKAALIVVDGLALDQWAVMRQELATQRPGWRFREGAVFAWVPTVTSVSRQAIFAGDPPFLFPESIHHTNKEDALWRRFWANENLGQGQVRYLKGLGDEPYDDVAALIDRPNTRVVGLVVDKVDRIMHGMELGAAGMHNQVRQWAALGHFAALLDLLLANGFRVYLTADHGNIEATGCGRPNEGSVADLRGERVRVYSDEELRRPVAERFPEAWQWPTDGLPADYLPLLAPGRSAFVGEGERVVAHGGVCLEELVVPFVEVVGR